ncbi:hypothetical protein CGC20_0550 [Leishmania donovani]|nr:hypothetical protein CGC20_0550 [Leishmania donovani]
MAPKKNNTKKETKRKELTEEDMLRLGMTPEDIRRILEERGKSSEDKQAEQAREEAQRREAEARLRQQRDHQKQVESMVVEETTTRATLRYNEDQEWTQMESCELMPAKQKILRHVAVMEAQRRAEEAKRRQAEELAAYQARLQSMSDEQRAAFLEEEKEKEKRRIEDIVASEEKRMERERRREARRKARKERLLNNENADDLLSSDDEEPKGKGAKKGKESVIDELEFDLHEKYLQKAQAAAATLTGGNASGAPAALATSSPTLLAADDSEAKDGMRRPTSRRPNSTPAEVSPGAGDETAQRKGPTWQQSAGDRSAPPAARSRIGRYLAPPRRKCRAASASASPSHASSSPSVSDMQSTSSRTCSSSSDRDARGVYRSLQRDSQRNRGRGATPATAAHPSASSATTKGSKKSWRASQQQRKQHRVVAGGAYSSTSSISSSSATSPDGTATKSARTSSDSWLSRRCASQNDEGNAFLSPPTSTSVEPICAFTDVLPRDVYLRICGFLTEADCCTLLEVSLCMHAAITSADSIVWRHMCVNTWMYKQGFQTFIQHVRALEVLARQEELEVQALQQHMLLLREQGIVFGESDVSATCDCTTVLIRRRQHERARWMAAAAAGAAASTLHRSRLTSKLGSATASASSTTQTDSSCPTLSQESQAQHHHSIYATTQWKHLWCSSETANTRGTVGRTIITEAGLPLDGNHGHFKDITKPSQVHSHADASAEPREKARGGSSAALRSTSASDGRGDNAYEYLSTEDGETEDRRERRVRIRLPEAEADDEGNANLTDTSVLAVRSRSGSLCCPRLTAIVTITDTMVRHGSNSSRHAAGTAAATARNGASPLASVDGSVAAVEVRARLAAAAAGTALSCTAVKAASTAHRTSITTIPKQRRNAAAGGGISTYFYQTATYEAIKSTTPVLEAQHIAPSMVPFKLGGRQTPSVSGAEAVVIQSRGTAQRNPHQPRGSEVHACEASAAGALAQPASPLDSGSDAAQRMVSASPKTGSASQQLTTRTAPSLRDGDELADEAALREWDELEASSLGSSSGTIYEEDADASREGDREEGYSDGNGASVISDDTEGRSERSTNEDEDEGEGSTDSSDYRHRRRRSRKLWRTQSRSTRRSVTSDETTSTTAPCRLSCRQRHGGESSTSSSSCCSSRLHAAPSSLVNGESTASECGGTADRYDSDEGATAASSTTASVVSQADNKLIADSSSKSSSGKRVLPRVRRSGHPYASLGISVGALVPSSSRLAIRAERRVAKALEKRYEGIEEAMVITRSKSVLIHTLERQTHAHLPRLLAAAQRQHRLMMNTLPAAAAAHHADPSLVSPTVALHRGAPDFSEVASAPTARAIILIGAGSSGFSGCGASTTLPAAASLAAPPASHLLSSLDNSFATVAAAALAVPASPLYQLARSSSSNALTSSNGERGGGLSGMLPCQGNPHSSPPSTSTASLAADTVGNGGGVATAPRAPLQGLLARHRMAATAVAAVGDNGFAFFMSRREAQRVKITLQDLIEGMWVVCFRSSGRTHPIRFVGQHQVFVYPPLPTTEEEEEQRLQQNGLESSEAGHATTTADATSATSAAPPLPFHILQGGAQLVVHQFPPMKVMRRNGAAPGNAAAGGTPAAVAPVSSANAPAAAAVTPAMMAERRFAAEPQATLRKLRLRMLSSAAHGAATFEAMPYGDVMGDFAAAGCAVDGEHNRGSGRGFGCRDCTSYDSHGAAAVSSTATTNDVRRVIAQGLGFCAAYMKEALGQLPVRPEEERTSEEEGATTRRGCNTAPSRAKTRRFFYGPLTQREYEAQQRRELCFAPGGAGDVLNDWGWTITSQYVKIFSLDITAPLYVKRLQRVADKSPETPSIMNTTVDLHGTIDAVSDDAYTLDRLLCQGVLPLRQRTGVAPTLAEARLCAAVCALLIGDTAAQSARPQENMRATSATTTGGGYSAASLRSAAFSPPIVHTEAPSCPCRVYFEQQQREVESRRLSLSRRSSQEDDDKESHAGHAATISSASGSDDESKDCAVHLSATMSHLPARLKDVSRDVDNTGSSGGLAVAPRILMETHNAISVVAAKAVTPLLLHFFGHAPCPLALTPERTALSTPCWPTSGPKILLTLLSAAPSMAAPLPLPPPDVLRMHPAEALLLLYQCAQRCFVSGIIMATSVGLPASSVRGGSSSPQGDVSAQSLSALDVLRGCHGGEAATTAGLSEQQQRRTTEEGVLAGLAGGLLCVVEGVIGTAAPQLWPRATTAAPVKQAVEDIMGDALRLRFGLFHTIFVILTTEDGSRAALKNLATVCGELLACLQRLTFWHQKGLVSSESSSRSFSLAQRSDGDTHLPEGDEQGMISSKEASGEAADAVAAEKLPSSSTSVDANPIDAAHEALTQAFALLDVPHTTAGGVGDVIDGKAMTVLMEDISVLCCVAALVGSFARLVHTREMLASVAADALLSASKLAFPSSQLSSSPLLSLHHNSLLLDCHVYPCLQRLQSSIRGDCSVQARHLIALWWLLRAETVRHWVWAATSGPSHVQGCSTLDTAEELHSTEGSALHVLGVNITLYEDLKRDAQPIQKQQRQHWPQWLKDASRAAVRASDVANEFLGLTLIQAWSSASSPLVKKSPSPVMSDASMAAPLRWRLPASSAPPLSPQTPGAFLPLPWIRLWLLLCPPLFRISPADVVALRQRVQRQPQHGEEEAPRAFGVPTTANRGAVPVETKRSLAVATNKMRSIQARQASPKSTHQLGSRAQPKATQRTAGALTSLGLASPRIGSRNRGGSVTGATASPSDNQGKEAQLQRRLQLSKEPLCFWLRWCLLFTPSPLVQPRSIDSDVPRKSSSTLLLSALEYVVIGLRRPMAAWIQGPQRSAAPSTELVCLLQHAFPLYTPANVVTALKVQAQLFLEREVDLQHGVATETQAAAAPLPMRETLEGFTFAPYSFAAALAALQDVVKHSKHSQVAAVRSIPPHEQDVSRAATSESLSAADPPHSKPKQLVPSPPYVESRSCSVVGAATVATVTQSTQHSGTRRSPLVPARVLSRRVAGTSAKSSATGTATGEGDWGKVEKAAKSAAADGMEPGTADSTTAESARRTSAI